MSNVPLGKYGFTLRYIIIHVPMPLTNTGISRFFFNLDQADGQNFYFVLIFILSLGI